MEEDDENRFFFNIRLHSPRSATYAVAESVKQNVNEEEEEGKKEKEEK